VGQDGLFDAGVFVYANRIAITITPYSDTAGASVAGPAFRLKGAQAFVETMIDDVTGKPKRTTAFNDQGSMAPTAIPASGTFFSYASNGIASHMWISWGWNAQTLSRADQSTVSVPAPPAAPAAPTLTDVAGGALGARTDFVRICYTKDGKLYPVSTEASRAISANRLLQVAAPTTDNNYDGWVVLVSATTNTETVQTGVQPFGAPWTEPSTGFTTNLTPWSSSWKSITTTELVVSTTYYFYGSFDVAANLVRVFGGTVGQDAPSAGKQNGDGRIPLSFGAMTAATLTAGTGNSGNGGGGKFL
jgi:hypothetical protein